MDRFTFRIAFITVIARQAMLSMESGPGAWRLIDEVTSEDRRGNTSQNLDPEHGKFVFTMFGAHYFTGHRVVEISILPWDDRPQIERRVTVCAWYWRIFPPFTQASDSDGLDDVTAHLEASFKH